MIANRLLSSSRRVHQSSVNVARLFSNASLKNAADRQDLLSRRRKNSKLRINAFLAAKQALAAKEDERSNSTSTLLGALGVGALANRLRGAKPRPTAPKGVRPRGRLGRLGRLPRLGGIANIAFTGIDFMQRRGEGQTNLQAGVGAAGGLLGGLGGMKAGAMAGGAIGSLFGGVGAVPGALIGGLLGSIGGSMLGGSIADRATGVDARRQREEQRTRLMLTKTPFNRSLDTFNSALDKLENLRTICPPLFEDSKPYFVPVADDRGPGRGPQQLPPVEESPPPKQEEETPWWQSTEAKIIGFSLLTLGAVLTPIPGDEAVAGGGLLGAMKAAGLKSSLFGRLLNFFKRPIPTPKFRPDVATPKVDPTKIRDGGVRAVDEALRRNAAQQARSTKNLKQLRGEESAFEIARFTKRLQMFSKSDLRIQLREMGDSMLKGGQLDQKTLNIFRAFEREFKRRGMEIDPRFQNFLNRQNLNKKLEDIVAPGRGGPQASSGGGETNLIALVPEEEQQPMSMPSGGGSTPTVIPASEGKVARYMMGVFSEATA